MFLLIRTLRLFCLSCFFFADVEVVRRAVECQVKSAMRAQFSIHVSSRLRCRGLARGVISPSFFRFFDFSCSGNQFCPSARRIIVGRANARAPRLEVCWCFPRSLTMQAFFLTPAPDGACLLPSALTWNAMWNLETGQAGTLAL